MILGIYVQYNFRNHLSPRQELYSESETKFSIPRFCLDLNLPFRVQFQLATYLIQHQSFSLNIYQLYLPYRFNAPGCSLMQANICVSGICLIHAL